MSFKLLLAEEFEKPELTNPKHSFNHISAFDSKPTIKTNIVGVN